MSERLRDLWDGLGNTTQDITLLVLLLVPLVLTALVTLWGYRPWPLVWSVLRRHRVVSLVFVLLVAASVGLGTLITSQERTLREGGARAAAKFDLIVAAPGSEVTMMLATVFLQPDNVTLLDGATFEAVSGADHVDLAAPIAFGDSFEGAPVVGTTPDFILHMADGALAEGRNIEAMFDAVAGAYAGAEVGTTITPTHGLPGDTPGRGVGEEHGQGYTVVGRLPPTGSPWDRAYLVSVESVWDIHALGTGHDPGWTGKLGPPFSVERFPGTPAIMVRAEALWARHALRAEFTTKDTMAFFPGAVLARLYELLGEAGRILSLVAGLAQGLVGAGVLAGLVLLARLMTRQLALLSALGAPRRFVFAVTWCHATGLIVLGTLLGLGLGFVAAEIVADVITRNTEIEFTARLGWREVHQAAGFASLAGLLALVPGWAAIRQPVVGSLRG